MIFHIRFAVAVIGLFISLVKVALSLFVGATLVFYVKCSPDEYANSIRWSRTGGLREMVQLLLRSYRRIPRRSTMVLVYAIIAGVFTLGVSTLLSAMVSRADMDGDSTISRAFTTHLNPYDLVFWTVYMRPESTVGESLTMMLNDTYRNPNPAPRTRYTPRLFAYESGCEKSTAVISNNQSTTTIYMPSSNVSCKMHIMVLAGGTFDWEPRNALLRMIDSNTWMAVVPAKPVINRFDGSELYDAIRPYFMAMERNHLCERFRVAENMAYYFAEFPEDGVLALPTTHATKCRDGVNGSLIFSVTYFQFAVNHIQDFDDITASILLDPISLPLLKPMSAVIDDGAFASPTNNLTLVILSKVDSSASDVDFFTCVSRDRRKKGGQGLICTYMLTSVIAVNPQPIDPTMEADLGREPNIWNAKNQLDFTIVHLPRASELEIIQEKNPLFSSSQIIKANAEATRYLASLGHNIQEYKDPVSSIDQLYVLYDAVELKDAYKVSTAAFIIVCTLTGLFVIIWAFSEKYPTVYNSSIYKTIYKELKSKDESTQMLMHCTHDPLAFNGNHVVPDPGDQPSVAPKTSSQNYRIISPKNPNDTPRQQHELQPLVLLKEIPAQSPFLSSWSIAISTPVMNPTTATTAVTHKMSTTPSRPPQET